MPILTNEDEIAIRSIFEEDETNVFTYRSRSLIAETISGNEMNFSGFSGDVYSFNRSSADSLTITTLTDQGPNDLRIWASDNGGHISIDGVDSSLPVFFYGDIGNDTFDITSNGNHTIYGRAGDDTLSGSGGNDLITGDEGNDTIAGGAGDDRLYGGWGTDNISAGLGNDLINGGDGNDTLNGDAGTDYLIGGAGDDVLYGGDDDDRLDGNDGNDSLYGGAGNDQMTGLAGEDLLRGGDGDDLMFGGTENDILYGNAGNDDIRGQLGDDILYGGLGDDILFGRDGVDQVFGEDGNDTIVWSYLDVNDTIDGGAGTDTLKIDGDDVSTVDLSALNISGIEIIDLENLNGFEQINELIINLSDIAAISDTNSLQILYGAADTVTINQMNSGNFVGTSVIDGVTFDQYSRDGSDVYIQSGGTVNFTESAVANDDFFSATEETPFTFTVSDLLTNDVNIQNPTQSLQIVNISSPGRGTLSQSGDSYTYTGNTNLIGDDTLTYTIQDELGNTDTATITISVENVNDAPIARDDDFDAESGTQISGNIFADNGNGADVDPDNESFSLQQTGVFATDKGNTITLNADGSFTYTPGNNFFGTDQFSYTITDVGGLSDTATIFFDITAPETSPPPPVSDVIFKIDDNDDIPNDPSINSDGPYENKTLGVNFTTASDVGTRQVIFEQGGGTRGFNIYIENGELVYSAYNYAEENWGFKEIRTPIGADQTSTATLVFEGAFPADGTITAYLDGVEVGIETGVGLLYNHNGPNVGFSNGTVYSGTNSNATNPFLGEVNSVIQSNSALDPADLDTFEESLQITQYVPVLALENPTVTTVIDDPAINDDGPYAEKTVGATFTTAADVTSTQMIFEQGGTVRGINIFIENGNVYAAVWNKAEENWGYREISANVDANTTYTLELVMDGALPANGSFTVYLNGTQIGQFNDVGYLYSHPGDIGFGRMEDGTVIHDSSVGGSGLDFMGDLEKIVEYNDALSPDLIPQLDAYLSGISDSPVIDLTGAGGASIGINGSVGSDNIDGTNDSDTMSGGDGHDQIYGFGGDDVISGDGGDDLLVGSAGNDTLDGGDGDDRLVGGHGNDILNGSAGNDRLEGNRGDDTINGGEGNDLIFGHHENDLISGGLGSDSINAGQGDDTVYGDEGNDVIEGFDGNDHLFGGAGSDDIFGQNGDDILTGGLGDDRLFGGAGNDMLIADEGLDILEGGIGSDTFALSVIDGNIDQVKDFDLAGGEADILQISDILTGFDPLSSNIEDFVSLRYWHANRTDLKINADGIGNDFETVALVLGSDFSGLSAQDLVDSGSLIV